MPDQDSNNNGDLLLYRLDSMEKKLDRVISQQEQAQEVRARQTETLKTMQDDLQELRETAKDHETRLRVVETAPVKKSADRWESITKLIVELIVAAALAVILAMIGLK